MNDNTNEIENENNEKCLLTLQNIGALLDLYNNQESHMGERDCKALLSAMGLMWNTVRDCC